MDYHKAFKVMEMEPTTYVLKFALPLIAIGFLFPAIMYTFFSDLFTGSAYYIPAIIPPICILFAVYYPLSILGAKVGKINNEMHYYITQMGVISTAETPRIDIIRILSENKSYALLSEESRKIYNLVVVWNLSLSDACRFISKRTPSVIFQDFLDRFAHGLQSGEDVRTFLESEQAVVMHEYESMYNSALYNVEVIKELFVSLVMALIFMASFAIIMPVITGMDAVLLMTMVAVMFSMVYVAILFFTRSKVPKDPIWQQTKRNTEKKARLFRTIPISLIACTVIAIVLFFYDKFPTLIDIPMVMTPLIYTGRMSSKIEKEIRRMDENYPAFIRSLGSSAGARGGMIDDALRSLTNHDFGALTQDVNDLFRRVNTRIDKFQAWEMFAANTGSNLIQRFSEIFVEATNLGGKPELIGDMLASNFLKIVNLRKKRYQSASSLVGVLYGLTAGIAFTLNISVSVVGLMQDMFTSMQMDSDMSLGMIIYTDIGSVQLLSLMIMFIVFVHAAVSALLIRVVNGGHMLSGTTDFVIMMWIGGVGAVFTENAVGVLLGT
ncbi:flagellar protein FlaJ [Methanohalophilus levihalophilus]|uniref:archaellar assembly protein FlaJ n=1 Tax=Methanohalophilus levihalophilus TaxID=1431282 RepID=UPI001AE67D14|nr:archaellar assembly protein FlaJ [Methanohalophilus levihalophilus]MBP2029973.1 flagellar protein FlaJ [Methanohalophilus levihalophilus]